VLFPSHGDISVASDGSTIWKDVELISVTSATKLGHYDVAKPIVSRHKHTTSRTLLETMESD